MIFLIEYTYKTAFDYAKSRNYQEIMELLAKFQMNKSENK